MADPEDIRHAAIVLAAGASRRLGYPKQLLEIDGQSLLARTVAIARTTRPSRLLVVVGANADAVFSSLEPGVAQRVDCAAWRDGLSAALGTGIARLRGDHADAALVLLCDQPALTAGHLAALLEAWRREPVRAAASAYADTIGVPAVLPKTWFPLLLGMRGDRGARDLLREQRRHVTTVPFAALACDLDTHGDLVRLAERSI